MNIQNTSGETIAIVRPSKSFIISEFAKLGFKLGIETGEGVKPAATCYRTVSKARFPKPIFNYFFRSEARLFEFIAEKYKAYRQMAEDKAKQVEAKKAIRENMENPFKVGDLLYDSWGYEQTNIDFYQVIEVKGRMVTIRRIKQKVVEGTEGMMCENVAPAVDNFIDEPLKRPVQFYLQRNNTPKFYVNGTRGSLMNYTYGGKGIYQSHYA